MSKSIEESIKALGGLIPLWGEKFATFNKRDIESLEKTVGFQLPDDYRWFLRTYACSCFNELMVMNPRKQLPRGYTKANELMVCTFYGKRSVDYAKTNTIRWRLGILNDYLPAGMIPIASDGGNYNHICLSLADETAGVYFWYGEHDFDSDEYEGRRVPKKVLWRPYYRIAATFSDLINRLRPMS